MLRWLQTVALPRFAPKAVTHQQLLRAMDALVEHQDRVQAALAGLLRPLIDQDLSVVFYDRTTIGVEGETELADDLRQFGMSKDGGIRRQFMLGVVQTAEGLPLTHRVWEGNTAEAPTLSAVVQEVLALYPVAGGRSRAAQPGQSGVVARAPRGRHRAAPGVHPHRPLLGN